MKDRKYQNTDLAPSIGPVRALGFGTLVARETEQWIARVMLMDAMSKVMPQELEELRSSTLGLYIDLARVGHEGESSPPQFQFPTVPMAKREEHTGKVVVKRWTEVVDSWASLQAVAAGYLVAGRLRDELSAWATARNMNVGWFLDLVLRNVAIWHSTQEHKLPAADTWSQPGSLTTSDNRVWGAGKHIPGQFGPEHALQLPTIPPYNPAMQTRKQHGKVVMAVLKGYHDVQEAVYKKAGFKRLQRKRSGKGTRDPWLAYTWFVRYQLQGCTTLDLLQHDPVTSAGKGDEDTFYRAIKGVAKLLDVPLRAHRHRSVRK